MNWTDEAIETLKRMWLDGEPSPAIARAMGVSRNSIVGKLRRLKLKRQQPEIKAIERSKRQVGGAAALKRAMEAKPMEEPKPRRVIKAPTTPNKTRLEPMPAHEPGLLVAGSSPRVWTTRKRGECAYPVDGDGAETRSCCLPADGSGYCTDHWAFMHGASKANAALKRSAERALMRETR